jgi:hypothetical protein
MFETRSAALCLCLVRTQRKSKYLYMQPPVQGSAAFASLGRTKIISDGYHMASS